MNANYKNFHFQIKSIINFEYRKDGIYLKDRNLSELFSEYRYDILEQLEDILLEEDILIKDRYIIKEVIEDLEELI